MSRGTLSKGLLTLAIAVLGAAIAEGQDTRPTSDTRPAPETRESFSVSIDGLPLETFLQQAEKALGLCLIFADPTGAKGKSIRMTGEARVITGGTRAYFEAVLLSQGYAIVPMGGENSNLAMVESIEASKNLKTRAPFVPFNELESWRDSVGRVIMTVIPTKYISSTSLRAAVAQMLQGRNMELVQEIPTGNALVVMGFAPTVHAVWRITEAMDLPPTGNSPTFELMHLENAVAEEIQPIIDDLLKSSTPSSGRSAVAAGGGAPITLGGVAPPPPKVIADRRQNALAIYAVEPDLSSIREIVRRLDDEAKNPSNNLRVIKLQHNNAADLADTLRDLIGISSSGSRGGGRANTNRTGGNSGSGATSSLSDVRVVADRTSNSLLISADATSWPILSQLIVDLDKPRKQIWIEAAMIELSNDDLEQMGVEITALQGGGDPGVGFASALGLSTTLRKTGTAGSGPLSFDSFHRVPFVNSTGGISFEGGVFGVFDDDFDFPALIALAQTKNKGRLVATPTILTLENSSSKVEVGRQIGFTSRNTSRAGTDQVSFGGYQEARTALIVTPYVASDNAVKLDIELSLDAFVGVSATSDVPPDRVKRHLVGSVQVATGKTALLGTLLQQSDVDTALGVPGLMDSPILGSLFRNRTTGQSAIRLLIFVRPQVMNQGESLDDITRPRLANAQAKFDVNITRLTPTAAAIAGHLDVPAYSPLDTRPSPDSRPGGSWTEGLK